MVNVKTLGLQDYHPVWLAMKQFTLERDQSTLDELWLLEHYPVYTQGQAGKACHILNTRDIPVVQSDRGGQVTYHGPGQLVVYTLVDIQRQQLGIRSFVSMLEQVLIQLLEAHQIKAKTQCGSPGVYVNDKKIASIGLRVKQGRAYHGIALNINMDLSPFHGIHPCGYASLQMTQMSEFVDSLSIDAIGLQFVQAYFQVVKERDGYS
jgi:lipoyl(octanoyl) transferase